MNDDVHPSDRAFGEFLGDPKTDTCPRAAFRAGWEARGRLAGDVHAGTNHDVWYYCVDVDHAVALSNDLRVMGHQTTRGPLHRSGDSVWYSTGAPPRVFDVVAAVNNVYLVGVAFVRPDEWPRGPS